MSNMSVPPGAFKPWVVYKYLKINTPWVNTAVKDVMGGEQLTVKNAATPIGSENFMCVQEDNEFKARILDTALPLNILTMERNDRMGPIEYNGAVLTEETSPKKYERIVSRCLLQDISLYRSMGGLLGLRLDYGHCVRNQAGVDSTQEWSDKKQTFIMIGLKRVPDNFGETTIKINATGEERTIPGETANVRGFFEGVCKGLAPSVGNANYTIENRSNILDLAKAHTQNMCFATEADMTIMMPLDPSATPPCFDQATAYTLLDHNDEFPTLPVRDSDYNFLLSKLPVGSHSSDDPCAPTNQNKKMYGHVMVDRTCVFFEGLNCTHKCKKFCQAYDLLSTKVDTTLPPLWLPPPLCVDCEFSEAIYAILATWLTIVMVYLTYYAFANMSTSAWKAITSEEYDHYMTLVTNKRDHVEPGREVDLWETGNRHGVGGARCCSGPWWSPATIAANLGLLLICLAWSVFWYYAINILDWAFCQVVGWELCIKVWSWQYDWDINVWFFHNQTYSQGEYLDKQHHRLGSWLLPWAVPWELNIDTCYFRLFGMILITWLCTWVLFCYWRMSLTATIKETTHHEAVARMDHIVASGFGAGDRSHLGEDAPGMFTGMLQFFRKRG